MVLHQAKICCAVKRALHAPVDSSHTRPGVVHGLLKRTKNLLSGLGVHAMETLFDELGDVLFHAKPTAIFRQPLDIK